jgi:hypothetical protein
MVSRSLPSSQISGRMYNTVAANKCIMCEKFIAARHDADLGIQLLFANNRNRKEIFFPTPGSSYPTVAFLSKS